MATYDLKYPGAAIDAILDTAYDLQNAGYIFKGSATAYSGTPTQRTWLLAPAGFSGYGFSSAIPKGSIGICKWNGSAWSGDVINVVTIDNYPTYGSTNAVTSGGMWNALDDLGDGIWATLQSFVIQDGTASANQGTQIKFDVKMTDGQQVQHLISSFGILAATTTKAGLMSAADKAKVDAFLDNLRSLSFTDTTPGADVGTKIVETLKMTVDGVQEAVTALTILAATTSKAGLMSATDKEYIDGLPSSLTSINADISKLLAMLGYYECSTAAGTAAKTVNATGYSLTNGGCIRIKMTNANTADNVTLNINSTGAKALYYDGAQASSTNTWEAGEVLEVYYDGTQYQCASGGGGKFASGQKVKDISIVDDLPNSTPLSDCVPSLEYLNDAGFADITNVAIDLSQISNSNIGYNQSTGKTSTMARGYYSKYVPVLEGYTYTITPKDSNHRVSFATFITKPTAAGQTANVGTEAMDQYGQNNPTGELGESVSIKIDESRFIYIRVDTANDSTSCAGGVTGFHANTVIDEDNSYPSVLRTQENKQILPITKAGLVKYGDSNVGDEINTIQNAIGTPPGPTIENTSYFEQGAIDNGVDVSSNDYMRTPASNPITVNGVGDIICVFTVPKPKRRAPWSKPYFFKDGVLVDATYAAFQVNNGTVWRYHCDGSFNQIRWRVAVSSVAAADISASSIACTFENTGSGIIGELSSLKGGDGQNVKDIKLYLGELAQSVSNQYGCANDGDTNYVCMKDALQIPFNGVTLKAHVPNGISVAVRLGEHGNDIATRVWLDNNESYTIPSNYNYYHLAFGRVNSSGTPTATTSLSEIEEAIQNGDIYITYKVYGNVDILQSRPESEIRARALRMVNNLPTFCHTSDQHGNVYGLSDVYRFADYIGVDAIINTGDTCSYSPQNGYGYAKELKDKYTIPTIFAVGNHDGYGVTGEAEIRTLVMDNFITPSYNIQAGKTYYYYDFASLNMRFIILNSSQTGYTTFNGSGCIMQDQIDFFVNALAGTPSGYGVIVLVHFPMVKKNLMIPNDFGFFNTLPEYSGTINLPFAQPIFDIIDAYIGRTTFSISYTNTNDGKMNDGSGTSVSKSGDFSSAVGEFICYLTGHTHQDRVAYYANTRHRQLCVNITSTASVDFQTTGEDIPRQGDGVCRNAFNIYSIDRSGKNVRIVRVGSDFNYDGIDRKFAIIRYADDA